MEIPPPIELLHGTLHACIFYATSPTSVCSCVSGPEEAAHVTIKLDHIKVAETSQEEDRVWNQSFHILCAHYVSHILICVETNSTTKGKLKIPVSEITGGAPISGVFPLLTERGRRNPKLRLCLSLHFKYPYRNPLKDPKFPTLSLTTFPQRSRCNLKLYQDAHASDEFPSVDKIGKRASLWEDVYKAIDGARHFIYVAGWSLNPKIVLVRDPKTPIADALGVSLGELLKRRAEEGVAVRVMLWNDETSLAVLRNSGIMNTHDEETLRFFRGTKVICRLCTRHHAAGLAVFAHHQKTITVDAILTESGRREIMSFIGGVDLCDGRYDNEHHYLFKTIYSPAHVNDFYQTCIAHASLRKGGPREAWHDAHACVTGAAAEDLLANFEQRWRRQCDPSLLIDIKSLSDNLSVFDDSSARGDWCVQVFRSIDRHSVNFLPENIHEECSIHEAYVQAIRHADRFIYIENQYFIGGCHLWESDSDCGCHNLIPLEIALKIAAKIKNKERFAVYILIPLWPEGIPEGEVVQDVLHWTRLTMKMMYEIVGRAIIEVDEHDMHPRDYLNFFCLATREPKREGEYAPPSTPASATHYWQAQKNRRFMIYVHSKLMIVDDEYLLIGSANVNQRSMDGKRDSEIVIGCYQPKHVGHGRNYGSVHEYRMALWCEHTRRMEEDFLEPQSFECSRRMRQIGEQMWKVFSGEDMEDMRGVHLVNYPITVLKDGSVADDGRTFPDTTAHVKGKRSFILPAVLTT